jgi:hypothetical protein
MLCGWSWTVIWYQVMCCARKTSHWLQIELLFATNMHKSAQTPFRMLLPASQRRTAKTAASSTGTTAEPGAQTALANARKFRSATVFIACCCPAPASIVKAEAQHRRPLASAVGVVANHARTASHDQQQRRPLRVQKDLNTHRALGKSRDMHARQSEPKQRRWWQG